MSTGKTSTNLLTEGSIPAKIVSFAVPLFLGNLFQLFYSAADSVIVGNFIDSDALAAVTASAYLTSLLVSFFNGISVGASVVTAKYCGAKDSKNLRLSIHTTIAFGIVAGLLLTIIGLAFTPLFLRLMETPADILPSSIVYLRVYFLGSFGFVLYNIFVGILRSVGDSKTPLVYLIISSVINVVLDLFFITFLHGGVASAALATIISQYISAILCLIRLLRTKEEYRIDLKAIRFDKFMLKQIIANGLPTGLQNSLSCISNVVIQSNINSFGKYVIAGVGAYLKTENFAFLPANCFAMAATTFVSQNLGAGRIDRVKKGTIFSILSGFILTEIFGIIIYFYAPHFIALFNDDPNVIVAGVLRAKTTALFYGLIAYSQCISGILRGAGKSTVTMLATLFCWCFVRVVYVTTVMHFIQDLRIVCAVYPITWALTCIVFTIYFFKSNWLKSYEPKKT